MSIITPNPEEFTPGQGSQPEKEKRILDEEKKFHGQDPDIEKGLVEEDEGFMDSGGLTKKGKNHQ